MTSSFFLYCYTVYLVIQCVFITVPLYFLHYFLNLYLFERQSCRRRICQCFKRPSSILCKHRMPCVQVGLPPYKCTTKNRTILDGHSDYKNARGWKLSALLLITVADCYCKVTVSVRMRC